jgi:type IV pilus assembly protein PilM
MAATNLIGLDIGSMSVRAVEISRGKDGPAITNFGHAVLPDGAVQAGAVTDDKAVIAALRQLWATTKFRSRKVALGITSAQVVVRELAVSNLPDKELHKSLPFQVRDQLPLPVERALLDFHRLGDPGDAETMRGLLVAAPKEAVLNAVHAVEKAGLHVARVDIGSFALLRAASRLDGQAEALIDIGARTMTVVVHVDGVPVIVRTIPRGGAEVTEALTKRLNISVAEAEDVKRRVGLRADADPQHADVIKEAVRPLINEVRSSFAYLTNGDKPTRIARLGLSGGGALLPGLVEALSAQLNVPASIADSICRLHGVRRVKYDSIEQFRSVAAIAIGLSLGAPA